MQNHFFTDRRTFILGAASLCVLAGAGCESTPGLGSWEVAGAAKYCTRLYSRLVSAGRRAWTKLYGIELRYALPRLAGFSLIT